MIYLRRKDHGELIIVSESNVILPGLTGHRIIEWSQLTNVIKRDDLLTLDFKNNRLMQVQIINADDVPENEFNQFCRQQLQENRSKKSKFKKTGRCLLYFFRMDDPKVK
jgi:hypothetical protein